MTGSMDFSTALTKSADSSDFVDLRTHYFSHAEKIHIEWNMNEGTPGTINSLAKILGLEGGKLWVDFNKLDHVVETEFLFKDKAVDR